MAAVEESPVKPDDAKVIEGADLLLKECGRLKYGESVAVICDEGTKNLGQLLTEWGVLNGTGMPGTAHSALTGWSVAVNGAKQAGPVQAVVLKAHDEVVLFHGTAPEPLPAKFTFPAGL